MTADVDADPDAQASGEAEHPDAELPGDESDQEPRREEPRVPLSRLIRQGKNLGAQIETLKQEIAALKEQKAPRKVAKADLEAEVDAGRLTRAEADAAWERQIKADVAAEVKAEVRQESREAGLSQQLAAYGTAVPELNDEDSETYAKVAEELAHLMSLGLPNNVATQLAACRTVLGPIGALKQVRKAPEPRREAHADGASGGGAEPGQKPDKPQLSAKQKNYYRGLIAKGVLPGWEAAYKEVAEGQAARAKAGF